MTGAVTVPCVVSRTNLHGVELSPLIQPTENDLPIFFCSGVPIAFWANKAIQMVVYRASISKSVGFNAICNECVTRGNLRCFVQAVCKVRRNPKSKFLKFPYPQFLALATAASFAHGIPLEVWLRKDGITVPGSQLGPGESF